MLKTIEHFIKDFNSSLFWYSIVKNDVIELNFHITTLHLQLPKKYKFQTIFTAYQRIFNKNTSLLQHLKHKKHNAAQKKSITTNFFFSTKLKTL